MTRISLAAMLTALGLLSGVLPGCSSTTPRAEPEQPPDGSETSSLTVVAEIALERGDCRSASESYARAAQGGDAELAKRAAQVAFSCEHLPAAWEAVQRWRALAPDDTDAATLYAVVALKLYKLREARGVIAQLARDGGRSSEGALSELAQMLLQESDPATVLAVLSPVAEGSGTSPNVLALLADIALEAYHLERAERYAKQALARDPQAAAAKRVLIRVYVLRGDAPRAIELAREIALADPEGSSFELADALMGLERLEEARQELERLHAEGVAQGEVERRLALLALESGDFDEAERRLTALATSGEGTDAAIFYLAEIAEREGDYESALAGYRRLANSQLAITARARAAGILLERGERAEALAMLDDYATEHPEQAFELTLIKARLFADHGDIESAIALLDAALERHPGHPSLQYERAVLLERGGQLRECLDALEKLLEERPGDPAVMNALGYTMADHGIELARAETLIRRALESAPDNPAMLDSLGWVRFRRGDTRAAIPILERAYALGRDPEIAAHWGEALWASGQQQQARTILATALARAPRSQPLRKTIDRLLSAVNP
ncbi:MAG: tetratricopeptide repeat protein [Pseudomonadota bacterium]